MSKCCSSCAYKKPSELKIQINEIPITAYCANKDSQYYGEYVWDDDICEVWKGVDDEVLLEQCFEKMSEEEKAKWLREDTNVLSKTAE